jgi:hypothetical protein
MYSETWQKRWNSTAARRKRECRALSGGAMNVKRFDTLARLCYVNALFIVGTLGTLIAPALLESWAKLQWSQSQLGLVAALELATLAAGSLSGLYWRRRWSWRQVASGSLLLAILANAACVVRRSASAAGRVDRRTGSHQTWTPIGSGKRHGTDHLNRAPE